LIPTKSGFKRNRFRILVVLNKGEAPGSSSSSGYSSNKVIKLFKLIRKFAKLKSGI